MNKGTFVSGVVELNTDLAKPKPRFFYGYWILFACFMAQLISSGLITYCFSMYTIPLMAEFGWNRGSIMLGSMIMSLISGLSAPLVGKLLYRIGAKTVIAIGALITGTGFVLLNFTDSLWQFYVFYAVVGIGWATMGIVPTSAVVSNWFKRRRGFAIGILGAGIGVGGYTMPLLSNFLITNYGWRISFLVVGVMAVIVMIPISLLIIKNRPEDMGLFPDGDGSSSVVQKVRSNSAPAVSFTFAEALKMPVFWLMAVAFLTFSFANQAIFQNHGPHLEDMGFSRAVVATAIGIVGIGSAFGKFGLGWLCDFIHPKYALVLGILFQSASLLILMTINADSPIILVYLYAILLGLGVGSWLPAMSMTTSTTFGLVAYGTIFGIINFASMLGGATGPVAAGMIFDFTGHYTWAFIMAFCFYAVAFPAIMLVRRPKAKKE
jgi:sugar phosphate permease